MELTFNRAISTLYAQPSPTIVYRQRIDLRNPYTDLCYFPYIEYKPEHETLILTLPAECLSVSRIKNSHGCKMVYSEIMDGFRIETVIDDQTHLFNRSGCSITIYTQSIRNLVILFDMLLIKPTFRSKL
jgi:hypothetical protein